MYLTRKYIFTTANFMIQEHKGVCQNLRYILWNLQMLTTYVREIRPSSSEVWSIRHNTFDHSGCKNAWVEGEDKRKRRMLNHADGMEHEVAVGVVEVIFARLIQDEAVLLRAAVGLVVPAWKIPCP